MLPGQRVLQLQGWGMEEVSRLRNRRESWETRRDDRKWHRSNQRSSSSVSRTDGENPSPGRSRRKERRWRRRLFVQLIENEQSRRLIVVTHLSSARLVLSGNTCEQLTGRHLLLALLLKTLHLAPIPTTTSYTCSSHTRIFFFLDQELFFFRTSSNFNDANSYLKQMLVFYSSTFQNNKKLYSIFTWWTNNNVNPMESSSRTCPHTDIQCSSWIFSFLWISFSLFIF